jgi:hypothetical protein
MNIFYLHSDPITAGQMQADKHVVKMILESAQMLSTAHRVLDGTLLRKDFAYVDGTLRKKNWYDLPDSRNHILYSATHINHPSSKWVRESDKHYDWLLLHWMSLLQEYTYRYEKTHKTQNLLNSLLQLPQNIPIGGFTSPPCAMNDHYIISEDAIENYRNYYKHRKQHLHKWTKRQAPAWIS